MIVTPHAFPPSLGTDFAFELEQLEQTDTRLSPIHPSIAPQLPALAHLPFGACRETIREVSGFRPSCAATLSGLGLMADMYDLSAMNMAMLLLGKTYGAQTPSQAAMMTSSVLVGAVAGQMGFGTCSDKIGRRNLSLLAGGLTLLGSLGSAFAVPINKQSPTSIYFTISAMRFLLGVGIGGEYPLSASNTIEHSQIKDSITALAYTMSILNAGSVLAAGVFTSLLALFPDNEDMNWRLGLGFGAILSAATLGLRIFLLQESPAFMQPLPSENATTDSNMAAALERQEESQLLSILPTAPANHSSIFESVKSRLCSPWMKPIAGAATTWFLYDIAKFGIELYSGEFLADKKDIFSASQSVLASNLVALPFSILSMITINDRLLGRQKSQVFGLIGMATMLGIMAMSKDILWKSPTEGAGISFDSQKQRLLFTTLFAAYRCCDAVGPGTSIFSFAGEIFPPRIRGTVHGFAAASGKLGAALGAISFPFLQKYLGTQGTFLLMSGACALAAAITKLYLPNYTNQHLHKLDEMGGTTSDGTTSDENIVKMLYCKDALEVNRETIDLRHN